MPDTCELKKEKTHYKETETEKNNDEPGFQWDNEGGADSSPPDEGGGLPPRSHLRPQINVGEDRVPAEEGAVEHGAPRGYEPHTPHYERNYSIDIGGFAGPLSRMKLKFSKGHTRVQKFNAETNAYYNVDDYKVVPYQTTTTLWDDKNLLDDTVVKQALYNMWEEYKKLEGIAKGYTGRNAEDLKENLATGESLIYALWKGLPNRPSDSTLHFLLIENTAGEEVTADNILGVGKIIDLPAGTQPGEKSSIILESVVAHPYTLISKNDEFIRYAVNNGLEFSQEDRARYNIKRIGAQLMRDGLKKTLKKIDQEVKGWRSDRPKNIQFSSHNPITARMGERFGARRVGMTEPPR